MSRTNLSTFVLSPFAANSIASSNVLQPVNKLHNPKNVPPPILKFKLKKLRLFFFNIRED